MEPVKEDLRYLARLKSREQFCASLAAAIRDTRTHLDNLTRVHGTDPAVTTLRLQQIQEQLAQQINAHQTALECLRTFNTTDHKENSNVTR